MYDPDNNGCQLDIVEIGTAASRKKCKRLCGEGILVPAQSPATYHWFFCVTAGEGEACVASLPWCWDRSEESCSGLLSRHVDNDNT